MAHRSDGQDARGTGFAVAGLLVVVVGIAIGLNGTPARTTPGHQEVIPPTETLRREPVSVGAPVAPATERVGIAPSPTPPAAPTPEQPADAEAPSIEEIVARAVEAVVQIETGDSRGTGFFVTPDTLVTNVHVVGPRSHVTIRRSDGRTASARVASTATGVDIAVLKVGPADRSAAVLRLGSGLNARVGQDVLAIGSALGTLQSTVTRGIISAVRRSGQALLLQTDAAVNPGNSGGPLLDRRGAVIGITTMGYVDRQGLNFAVAIDHARPLVDGQPVPIAITTMASASPATTVEGLSPAVTSASDQARTGGQKAYDDALRQAAMRADSLDDDWQRYRRICQVASVAARGSREWFAALGPPGTSGAVDPSCASWLEDIRSRAQNVSQTMQQAEEAARRADVFPGVRRDLRRRYRLDFDGWDR